MVLARRSRRAAGRVIIYAAAILFAAATVRRFHWLGGPYFELPATIQDHVWPARFPSRDAIVLSRRAEPLLPRDAKVTILKPGEAPNYDQTHWLTGLGMLPRQQHVPQNVEETKPDYVIAIHEEFVHPAYVKVATFPEGALYKRQ